MLPSRCEDDGTAVRRPGEAARGCTVEGDLTRLSRFESVDEHVLNVGAHPTHERNGLSVGGESRPDVAVVVMRRGRDPPDGRRVDANKKNAECAERLALDRRGELAAVRRPRNALNPPRPESCDPALLAAKGRDSEHVVRFASGPHESQKQSIGRPCRKALSAASSVIRNALSEPSCSMNMSKLRSALSSDANAIF